MISPTNTDTARTRLTELHRRYVELDNAVKAGQSDPASFARECGDEFCNRALRVMQEVRNEENAFWQLAPELRSGLVESINALVRFREACTYARGQDPTLYPHAPSAKVFEVLNSLFISHVGC